MTRWGWVGIGAGTLAATATGLAFSGVWPAYSAQWGLFPATAAGYHGNAALMRRYLMAHPPRVGVDTPQNALAWQLMDDLAGTQFGYTVSGIQHTLTQGVVSNTPKAPPAGAVPRYAVLGINPFNAGQRLIGKYYIFNGAQALWQVYAS